MHFFHLLYFLGHFVNATDRLFQQPLSRAVPDWEELLDKPAETLARGEIAIGPKRRWFSNLILAAGWTLLIGLLVGDVFLGPQGLWQADPGVIAAWITLAVVCFAAMAWTRRGGHAILTPKSVTLRSGASAVECPWALFNIGGDPFPLGGKGTLLPVAPGALYQIVIRRGERPAPPGTPHTPFFTIKSSHQILLADLYVVSGKELGALLLFLGRALAPAPPVPRGESPAGDPAKPAMVLRTSAHVLATLNKDGSIVVPLTHLNRLPGHCCSCGTATDRRSRLDIVIAGVVEMKQTQINIPLCEQCVDLDQRRRRRWMSIGLGIGIGTPAALFILGFALGSDDLMIASVIGLFLGALLGGVVGAGLSQGKSAVVVIASRIDVGTVTLKFRNPAYAAIALRAINEQL